MRKTANIEITEEELKEIIIHYLEHKGFKASSEDVKFHVSRHLEGFGNQECEVMSFDGCTVDITE